MKKRLGLLTLLVILVCSFLLLPSANAPEAAPHCVQCPLQPLPDDCPPCTEFQPQTCRRCASCRPIPGCKT